MTELIQAPGDANPPVRRRVVEWADPSIAATSVAGRAGVDFLRAIADGEIPPPPVAALLGMRLTDVEPGRVVFELEVGEHLYNPIGSVHGGIISTVLDSAMGCAVHSNLERGQGYTTLELKVNFDRAVTIAVAVVRAEAEIVTSGRRVATAVGRLVGPDGTLYAHASTTCLVFEAGR
ncbi:MAG: PaaI family thioesterase [Acidimicrobiales bacterium]